MTATSAPPVATPAVFEPAQALERALGDPHDAGRPTAFLRGAAADAREAFPQDACDELQGWGLHRWYVPDEHGGRLDAYDNVLQLLRVVARRDLTVAIAHGKTFLGAVPTWVAAAPQPAAELGASIVGGSVVALGLTERDHGADLLAGEVSARPVGRGFVVNGEKWLINNATRGDAICLLAATDPARGPRGFDLLLVVKRELAAGSYECLPKVRTLGIRGADISGIVFRDAAVPAARRIGVPGSGIETLLRALQVTRTLCTSLSLGAADTALRLVTAFARGRRLYGRRLLDLPRTRRVLADAYADVLVAEAVSIVATRSLQALPHEASISSAVAKYLVPTIVDDVIARLAELLGARAYLTEVHAHGLFQKVQRDHRIVGLFDGSAPVNLYAIANQGPVLARAYKQGNVDPGLDTALRLDAAPGTLGLDRLALVARRGCSVLNGLSRAVTGLDLPLADRVVALADEAHAGLATARRRADAVPTAAFTLAQRYALCYAAACCVGLWRHGAGDARLWDDALWLHAALRRVLARLDGNREPVLDETEALMSVLESQCSGAQMLSLFPFQLADGPW